MTLHYLNKVEINRAFGMIQGGKSKLPCQTCKLTKRNAYVHRRLGQGIPRGTIIRYDRYITQNATRDIIISTVYFADSKSSRIQKKHHHKHCRPHFREGRGGILVFSNNVRPHRTSLNWMEEPEILHLLLPSLSPYQYTIEHM